MEKMFSIFFLSLVTLLFTTHVLAQSEAVEANSFHSPFRYLIVRDATDIERYVNRIPNESLRLEVLIEEKAFTENNLKLLCELLSNRFKASTSLWINIYTSLDAIKTPEENDHSNLKGPVNDYHRYKRARFMRNPLGNEWFSYSIPPKIDEKIVVIKWCYIKCD